MRRACNGVVHHSVAAHRVWVVCAKASRRVAAVARDVVPAEVWKTGLSSQRKVFSILPSRFSSSLLRSIPGNPQQLDVLSRGSSEINIGGNEKYKAGVCLDKVPLTHQFIALLGPPWNTLPFFQPNSHAWLSVRLTPWWSAVSIGATRVPGSSFHALVAGDQTSPFLLPRTPALQEPPMVNTLASDRIAEDW